MPTEPRPDDKPVDPTTEKDEKVGWIDGLAKRSAGLPDGARAPKKDSGTSPWSYAGIGLQFAATTALFFGMGLYVDRYMGWFPWATVGFTMLGLVGGMYLLIKDAIKRNADSDQSRKRPKDGTP